MCIEYNGEKLITKVYVVIWDGCCFKAVFRNKKDAEDYVSEKLHPSMHTILEKPLL